MEHNYLLIFILYFNRDSNPTRYEIKSDLSLEEPGVIGPPFNFTFQVRANDISTKSVIYCTGKHYSVALYSSLSQIQNLGYFPVRDLQLNIEIPEMTKNGNQLLQISDFYIDQVSVEPHKSDKLMWKDKFCGW